MKRFFISAALLGICLVLCVVENLYLENSFEELENNLTLISSNYDDTQTVLKVVNDSRKNWEDRCNILSLFINHTTLEEIGLELKSLETSILSNDLAYEIKSRINNILYLTKNISDNERFGIVGLF